MEWFWIAIAIAFLVIELNTLKLVAAWVSVAASSVMMIKGIFPDVRLVWQLVIFLCLASLLILLTYPIIKNRFNKE